MHSTNFHRCTAELTDAGFGQDLLHQPEEGVILPLRLDHAIQAGRLAGDGADELIEEVGLYYVSGA